MNRMIVFFTVVFLFSACGNKQSKYPNVTTAQIFTQLPWGMNHSAVDKYLTEECKTVYFQEIPNLPPLRTYVYNGGQYNGVETKSWTVYFYNDSLIYVSLWVHEESDDTRKKIYDTLCELNDVEFTKDSMSTPESRKWYYQKEGERMSNIIFSDIHTPRSKDFAILLSKAQ